MIQKALKWEYNRGNKEVAMKKMDPVVQPE